MYLYANDPYETKYYFFIKKREITDLKHFHGFKSFDEYTNEMDNIY